MKWRRWVRAVHRDVGYVAVALVLAYSISGLAVNHIEDWNPNYRFETRSFALGPVPGETAAEQAAVVIERLRLDARQVRGHFQESLHDLRIFLPDGQEARLDVRTGQGRLKTVTTRAVLFEVNALHLNNLKGVWTYVADVFAVALIFLAISGMIMMKGDRGLAGRGKWFVLAGLAVPVGFIVYMYW
ncbi:MAG: PepSY-associated TM helix domain-containing protein [Kofleriaceae bacterium]|nr:PepSY-associated TM helix domain-containing protein [Kofleriaceae bacterium]MCL4227352.1 PepSY-associated TM helix domain-containing protein [Myxococcales bacterium]